MQAVREAVESGLRKAGMVSLAVDSWEDHAKCGSIGMPKKKPNHLLTLVSPGLTARPLCESGNRPFLVHWCREEERQTAEYLARHLRNHIDHLRTLQCKVVAVVSDNGANVQAALGDLPGVLSLNCLAHSGVHLMVFFVCVDFFLHCSGASPERHIRNLASSA